MIVLQANNTIYNWVSNHPELVEILKELGFNEIVKPGMIQTVGRIMTIKKGCMMRDIDFNYVVSELEKRGYKVEDTI
jgi:hypothetical protein